MKDEKFLPGPNHYRPHCFHPRIPNSIFKMTKESSNEPTTNIGNIEYDHGCDDFPLRRIPHRLVAFMVCCELLRSQLSLWQFSSAVEKADEQLLWGIET